MKAAKQGGFAMATRPRNSGTRSKRGVLHSASVLFHLGHVLRKRERHGKGRRTACSHECVMRDDTALREEMEKVPLGCRRIRPMAKARAG